MRLNRRESFAFRFLICYRRAIMMLLLRKARRVSWQGWVQRVLVVLGCCALIGLWNRRPISVGESNVIFGQKNVALQQRQFNESLLLSPDVPFGARGLDPSGQWERIRPLRHPLSKLPKRPRSGKDDSSCVKNQGRDWSKHPVRIATSSLPADAASRAVLGRFDPVTKQVLTCHVPCVEVGNFRGADAIVRVNAGLFERNDTHWLSGCYHTREILLTMESHFSIPSVNSGFVGARERRIDFDLLATTRLDSNIPLAYINWSEFDILRPLVLPKRDDAMAVAVISNCNAPLPRIQILQLLQEYGVVIHSYGACAHNKDEVGGRGDKVKLLSGYKFTLAFENVVATDYVTEKIAHAWTAGSVPIYLGTQNMPLFAPSPHSYISAADFPSIRALADEIVRLSAKENEAEYLQYLVWKKRGVDAHFNRVMEATSNVHSMCRICAQVQAILSS